MITAADRQHSFASSHRLVKKRATALKRLVENAARRAKARLPTRHALVIRSLVHAQMLPSLVGSGLTADEHRKLRNKLKAMRRARRQ